MKPLLVTALSALLLSLVLTSIAVAEELPLPPADTSPPPPAALPQTGQAAPPAPNDSRPPGDAADAEAFDPYGEPAAAQTSASQATPLPVSEAKKRYAATQEQLQHLVKGGLPQSLRVEVKQQGNDAEIVFHEPRDRLRTAVAEALDARRQLQQAELAELEARVARIKRALAVRDAMRETIIDQRTDELLEQMEGGDKMDQPGGATAPAGARPASSDSATAPPAEPGDAVLKQRAQFLKSQLAGAGANFQSADRVFKRARRLFESGTIDREALNEAEQQRSSAKLILDRSVVEWDAFREAHPDLPVTKGPPDAAADTVKRDARLLELDVDEANAILKVAENAYRRALGLRRTGAIDQAGFDEHDENYKRAKIQLERAKVKRDAFREAHPDLRGATEGDGAVNDQPRTQPFTPLDAREAELDVQEAEANLSAAKRALEYAKKMLAKGYVTEGDVDERAVKYERSKINLERAKAKLKALAQPPADDRAVDEPTRTSSAQPPLDDSQIVWGPKDTDRIPASAGEPIASIQIGHVVEPKKAAYAPGEVVTVKLFLKYTGKQTGTFRTPRSEILEKLAVDLILRDAAGEKLNWGWGPAHKQPVRSGHDLVNLTPEKIYPFPPLKILVGPGELVGGSHEPAVFAYLDVKPGTTAILAFKLTGDGLNLLSGPFDFRVSESAAKPHTGDDSVTKKSAE